MSIRTLPDHVDRNLETQLHGIADRVHDVAALIRTVRAALDGHADSDSDPTIHGATRALRVAERLSEEIAVAMDPVSIRQALSE